MYSQLHFSNFYFEGTWIVKDIHPNSEGQAQKVKVKVRINLHGIMTISSASLYESKECPETETTTTEQQQQQDAAAAAAAAQQNQQSNEQNEQVPNENVPDGGSPEVGSSWTKKISAWFSGVRI